MATDLVTPVVDAWMNYVFGDAAMAGIIILFFLILWGLKQGWSGEVFIVLLIPMIFLLAVPAAGMEGLTVVFTILLVLGGVIIGLAIWKLMGR